MFQACIALPVFASLLKGCVLFVVFFSTPAPYSSKEDVFWPTLSLPGPNRVKKYTVYYSGDDDYDNEEETLAMEDLDETSRQTSAVTAEDWLPKKESG